jgi:hypothetical protein
MATQKYQQFYDLLWENNQALLDEFRIIHDKFAAGDASQEEEFHTVGLRALDKIRDWDRRLCAGMSRGQFSQYSVKLSEKFWDRVRKDFKLIDEVGVRTKKV